MDTDVFRVFSAAVVSDKWVIGSVQRATETGDVFSQVGYITVIEDLEETGDQHKSPDADGITAQTLLYAKPDTLPTTNPAKLVFKYVIKDTTTDTFFAIVSAGLGKNQENGKVEHIELTLKPTEVVDA